MRIAGTGQQDGLQGNHAERSCPRVWNERSLRNGARHPGKRGRDRHVAVELIEPVMILDQRQVTLQFAFEVGEPPTSLLRRLWRSSTHDIE